MNSNVLELLKILKSYSSEIENVIENNNIEFNEDDVDGELSVLIENIMCDLKDLDRNIR